MASFEIFGMAFSTLISKEDRIPGNDRSGSNFGDASGGGLLPDAVSYKVFGQLDLVDLVQASQVCKEFRRQTHELRRGWQEEKAAAEANRYNWGHD